jgi:hypothetical protein
MDQNETSLYIKNLEELVKLRTQQGREAVATLENLLHLLGDAAPALQKLKDDPTVKRLLEKVPVTVQTVAPVFGGKPGEPVPAVDPDDLKAVWQLHRDVEASYPGERFAIDMSIMAAACKPGADVHAIAYRAGQLAVATQMLPQQLTKLHKEGYLDDAAYRAAVNNLLPAQVSSRMKDGQLDDAVFRAAATVSMEWTGVGVVRDGLPFNMDEFARLIAQGNGSGT